ncbi:UDP-glucose 4-epimerase [Nakamurella sp. UYEF19]|uniref:NAD-dependent epimerase/dehydratase family protein n=1 Tax=Nakamurella sp. UYEF19 TaxID=1756392 RepID=UPI0033936257
MSPSTVRVPSGDAGNGRPAPVTWVIGAGGLLGKALTNTLEHRPGTVLTSPIAWTTRQARADLVDGLDRLAAAVRSLPDRGSSVDGPAPWRIAWSAGAGVTGTTDAILAEEVATLEDFLTEIASRRDLGTGTVFLSSSAGGLHAGGNAGRPYDERDVPVPISAYGRAKLAGERVATDFAAATGHRMRIGRMSNLYGPGQNLSKGQGLISHLCRGNLTRQPISVYVSLDTIRDYLFVTDCASMVADMLDHDAAHEDHGDQRTVVKILASQQGTTIAALVAVCRQVFKRSPRLVLGSSVNAMLQVKDLRFRSVVWPELDRRTLTTLPAGIAATAAGMLRTAQTASR